MNLYINGTGFISAAGSNTDKDFLLQPPAYNTNRLAAKEPNYTSLIPPMQLRRMSKAVRMGIAASKACLQQSGIEKADAISVGTALGCLNDSEHFLSKMINQDEQMLTPTSFIQSTHNTVAGQIALVLGCNGHNLTFVHRGHSFEHALINAQLHLQQHPDQIMLAGGIDELTDTSFAVMQQANIYTKENHEPADMANGSFAGSIAGEGAAFFTLSTKPLHKKAIHLKRLETFVTKDIEQAQQKTEAFVQEMPELVILGDGGNDRYKSLYDKLANDTFKNTRKTIFKHISGEYATASAIALGLITDAVQKNSWKAQRIMLINNFMHHYSCYELEVVG